MANPHYARLMASNRKLLQTGKYSDLVIKCEGREWNVHRFIVCERSKFFATACDGPFLVSEALPHIYAVAIAHASAGVKFQRNHP